MASLKAIRRRIASAKSTQQITRAMKLVSAARLRRAQEALHNSLPYSEALARVADSLLTSEGISVGPVEGAQKRSLRGGGLVGSRPGRRLQLVSCSAQPKRRCATFAARGLDIELFAVGKKAVDQFRRTNVPVGDLASRQFSAPGEYRARARHRAPDARRLQRRRDRRGRHRLHVIFSSAISQNPVYERLLPIEPPGDAGNQAGRRVEAAVSGRQDAKHRIPGRTVARGTDAASCSAATSRRRLPCAAGSPRPASTARR